MKAGRPTLYKPNLLRRAKEYIKATKDNKDLYPSIAELAITLSISRETVYAWQKDDDKEEFSDIVKELMALQETRLTEFGLTGKFNATIAKLLLGKHGYKDTSDVTSNDKPINTVMVKFLEDDRTHNRNTE